jgi:hypothetical protein
MTFFTILLPFMIYAIATLFVSLLKFIKLLHIEEQGEDDGSFLTLKQKKLLGQVLRNLACYFGLYFLS